MNEHEYYSVVEQARDQLQSLRSRLVREAQTSGSSANLSALTDLLATLEKMHVHCGRVHEVLARSGAAAVQREQGLTLASHIVIDEEQSRQTMAADLHSGLAQDIALAKLELATLRSSSSVDHREALARVERLVEQADGSLRSITNQLCPPSLHDLGLVPALEWLGEEFRERYGVEVHIEDGGVPALADEPLRVILFRAVRSLLLNAVTRVGATQIHVWLGPDNGSLRITVHDDGSDLETASVGFGNRGLLGTRELLLYVGGSLTLASEAGQGTTVTLSSPLTFSA